MKMNVNIKGVATKTWIRIGSLLLILINQVAISLFDFRLIPFSDNEIYEGVSVILTIVITIWTSWKNNSITKEGQVADEVLQQKKGDK